MADNEKPYVIEGFTGVQRRSTIFLSKPGEVDNALNADFSKIVGAASKRLGYEQKGDDFSSTTTTSTTTSTTSTTSSTSSSTSTTTTA